VNPQELVVRLGIPLATFVYCVASGFLPLFNAELFLVGVASVAPRESLPLVAALAAAGQMVSKSGWYLAGSGAVRLPMRRHRADVEAVQARVARWRSKDLLVLVSAAVGLPPFFATSILAGTLRLPFARFLAAGYVGRLLRFGTVVAVPAVGRWLVGRHG
jgi:membrane protein YqaA with SNARE-associated domain